MGSAYGRASEDTNQTRLVMIIVTGVVLAALAIGGGVYLLVRSKDRPFTITTHEWRREVAIETLHAVDESEWCDRMPPGAKKVSRHREIKETRQVRDGETCSDVRVESNGRTTTRRECKTRYREEPIYADRCSYTADRWQPTRTESVKGPRSEEPRWPPVKIETPGHGLGAEREGPRKERFVVVVRDVKGVETVCDLERAHWAALPTEGGLEGDVAALTGKVECASLKSP